MRLPKNNDTPDSFCQERDAKFFNRGNSDRSLEKSSDYEANEKEILEFQVKDCENHEDLSEQSIPASDTDNIAEGSEIVCEPCQVISKIREVLEDPYSIPPINPNDPGYIDYSIMLETFHKTRVPEVFEIFSKKISEVYQYMDVIIAEERIILENLQRLDYLIPDIIQLKNFTLLPEYLLGVSILYILIVITWLYRKNYVLIIQKSLSEIFGILMLMVCYLYYNDLLIFSNSSLYKAILNDDLAKFAKFTISFFSAIYFITLAYSFKEQKLTSPEYTLLLSFSILGLLIVCSGNDLLTIYLSLELISLSSYVLAAFKKSQYSNESGLKYFITGSISSSFFLLGSSLLYLETNSIYLIDYTNLLFYTHNTQPETINNNIVDIALLCIFFSLFIKLACAPFHLWSLDVYEESPTSSGFYFATITKLSLFIVLIRLSFYVFCKLCFVWATLFTIIGMLSAFIGALGGLRQKKLKTLLAYSSISNMGYALIVLGGFSDAAVWAMLVHVVIYQFSGLCIWSLLIMTRLKFRTKKEKFNKELSDLALLTKANTSLALAFIITIFSLAGIPPLLGFVPKIYIISNVLSNNFESAAIFLALCSVIATFYYIRVLKVLFFENLLVGKLYFPILSFYSLILSFLIHSIVYAFSDIEFITAAILGGSSFYSQPQVAQSDEVFPSTHEQEFQLKVLYCRGLIYTGLVEPTGLEFLDLKQQAIYFIAWVLIRNWAYNELLLHCEVACLQLLGLCGWQPTPDNDLWFLEAFLEKEIAGIQTQHSLLRRLIPLLYRFHVEGKPLVLTDSFPLELYDCIADSFRKL